MALTRTTLSAACAQGDTTITVASATGFAAGSFIRVDDELMQIGKAYVSGTVIPVGRGKQGTAQVAHVVTAGVVVGLGTDFDDPAAQTAVTYPLAGRNRTVTSITATGTLPLPKAGSDAVVILNGTSVIALTVPVPTADMDGTLLWIASNGAAAHTVTFTGGLSGAGSNYDVLTVNATAPVTLGPFMAVNQLWQAPVGVAMSGTVTNITAALA